MRTTEGLDEDMVWTASQTSVVREETEKFPEIGKNIWVDSKLRDE